jgi:hypothetical protein
VTLVGINAMRYGAGITDPADLVLEMLRDIRHELGEVRATLRDHTLRLGELALGLTAVRREQANNAEVSANLATRVDRLRDDVDRI